MRQAFAFCTTTAIWSLRPYDYNYMTLQLHFATNFISTVICRFYLTTNRYNRSLRHRLLDALFCLWSPSPTTLILSVATLPSYSLDIPLYNPHRRDVHLPPLQRIKDRSPQKDSPKHDDIPIHRIRLHRCACREKAKYKEGHKKYQRYYIDCHPRTA